MTRQKIRDAIEEYVNQYTIEDAQIPVDYQERQPLAFKTEKVVKVENVWKIIEQTITLTRFLPE